MSKQESKLDDFAGDSDESERKSVRWGPKRKTIPGDWEFSPICDHTTELIYPQRDKPTRFDGDIPWVRIEDLDGVYISKPKDGRRYVSRKLMDEMNLRSFPEGTLMCSCSASMGVCAITTRELLSNQTFAGIVTNDSINTHYLYYTISDCADELEQLATGTTISYLSTDKLEKFHIPVPRLDEQRKIASVLYNVDQAIQKTQQVIESLKRIREGAEQDILSRGLLPDGSLRPKDQISHVDSWVGEVPNDWDVCQYGDMIDSSSVGIVVKPSQYYDDSGTVPILRSKDITRDGIAEGEFEYMTEESNKENSNSQLSEGDVITVRSGDPGLSCVVSSDYDNTNCADLLISTPSDRLDPNYAAMWLNSFAGRKQIDRFQAGLAQKHFNLGALQKLRIALPPLDEQDRIVDTVGSVTDQIHNETGNESQLKSVKKGLMQDLLSGKVSTTDKNIEVLDEILQHG